MFFYVVGFSKLCLILKTAFESDFPFVFYDGKTVCVLCTLMYLYFVLIVERKNSRLYFPVALLVTFQRSWSCLMTCCKSMLRILTSIRFRDRCQFYSITDRTIISLSHADRTSSDFCEGCEFNCTEQINN